MTWSRLDLSRRSLWTKAEIRQARQRHLKPVLEHLGYRLLPRQNGNYAISDLPCIASATQGLAHEIIIKEHYWNCPDSGQAGNAIDFFVKIRGVTFNEAMTLLSGNK